MSELDEREFAVALAGMARDLLAHDSVQGTLDSIIRHAVGLVNGCEHAGVLLVRSGRRVETVAATDDLVRESDRNQGELAEGPCFDAAERSRQVYRIADLTETQEHWPRFAARARDLGIGSMLGFLLYTDEDELGALNMYSAQPKAFTEDSELAGWLLASHAAVALSSARTHVQLHTAMRTRQEIGEALGIVMERYGLDDEQAFDLVRKVSQDNNIKLRDVAARITTGGQLPPQA